MTAIIFATFKVMNKVCIVSTLRSHNRDPPIGKQLILFFWPFPQTKALYFLTYQNIWMRRAFLCNVKPSGIATIWTSYVVLCWVAQLCPTLCDAMDYIACQPPLSMGIPDKNTGVGCHSLLQGIFPAQGSNPGLRHCRWILYCLYLIGYK